MANISEAMRYLRSESANDTDLGKKFELLAKVFLQEDPTQSQRFEKVVPYREWASKSQQFSPVDTGIDLVGIERESGHLCAIQCKGYDEHTQIKKSDLDSFISASSSQTFSSLMLIDTSSLELGPHALTTIKNLSKPWTRLSIEILEDSPIDWSVWVKRGQVNRAKPLALHEHQQLAIDSIVTHYKTRSRGKLIMACGTGKTFTALKLTERLFPSKGLVAYFVPSLALMSQTIQEWKNNASSDFIAYAVCSDSKVGKRGEDDPATFNASDLVIPATSDAKKLSEHLLSHTGNLQVIFCTYQSSDILSKAQELFQVNPFDLLICDEAHRTTGATASDEDYSNFVRVHDDSLICAAKRLYMTATPRIYGDKAHEKASKKGIELISMDDESIYGPTFFHRGFGWAVEHGFLVDYKVIVLAIDQRTVSHNLQKRFESGSELNLDEATKIIGCFKALSGKDTDTPIQTDSPNEAWPTLRSALSFSQTINESKLLESEFSETVEDFLAVQSEDNKLEIQVQHVDGGHDSHYRSRALRWLADRDENQIKILSNARCLSEGVDVPSLDAVIFFQPRRSHVDIIQSVGRVMRKPREGSKTLGYIILPIAIPPDLAPEDALNQNDRFDTVWQILNALRSHDERLEGQINKIGIGNASSENIVIAGFGFDAELDTTTQTVDDLPTKNKGKTKKRSSENKSGSTEVGGPQQLGFVFNEFASAIKAQIVKKCGTRAYWQDWAKNIAKIAEAHETRIDTVISQSSQARKYFLSFLDEVRDDLNCSLTEKQLVQMLAHHIITKPIFEALFDELVEARSDPTAEAFDKLINSLIPSIKQERKELAQFYDSVRRRVSGQKSAEARQTLITELYQNFFKIALPDITQRLGVVYTPISIIDFILNSSDYILSSHFGRHLSDHKVKIIDPFSGTGSFISRLITCHLSKSESLVDKYQNDISFNEIILLAYYISKANIESAYLAVTGQYCRFKQGCLTDSFELFESGDQIVGSLKENSLLRKKQLSEEFTVIIGNPPYSASSPIGSEKHIYPRLRGKIKETWVDTSRHRQKSALYDLYIHAIKWAEERLENRKGIISFITNNNWIEKNIGDGMRASLYESFQSIYVINLHGNIRNQRANKASGEGGNVFGMHSQAGISILFLVKDPSQKGSRAKIHYYSIGSSLTTNEKLDKIQDLGSIQTLVETNAFQIIAPDRNNDWLKQVESALHSGIKIYSKQNSDSPIFRTVSSGIKTNRDGWLINWDRHVLLKNVGLLIGTYNRDCESLKLNQKHKLSVDPTKIKWDDTLKEACKKNKQVKLVETNIVPCLFRPYVKKYLYYSKILNNSVYTMQYIFPVGHQNIAIGLTGLAARTGFQALVVDDIPSYDFLEKAQFLPLRIYEFKISDDNLPQASNGELKSNIDDSTLAKINEFYGLSLTDEDFFALTYALLHNENYLSRYENYLHKFTPIFPIKSLTRTGIVELLKYGKRLIAIHINPVLAEKIPLQHSGSSELFESSQSNAVRSISISIGEKEVIVSINQKRLSIPKEALSYRVGAKSAIEGFVHQLKKRAYKDSLIIDAPIANESQILDELMSLARVSLETIKIKKQISKIEFI